MSTSPRRPSREPGGGGSGSSSSSGSGGRRGSRRREQGHHESKFVDHILGGYPLLDELVDTYHQKTPMIIQLPVNLSCNIGNKVVTPFIPSPKNSPIIQRLDELGDQILDAIDNKMPIITYPMEDIKHAVIEEPLTQAYDVLVARPVNTVKRTRETYQDYFTNQAKKAMENIDRDIVPFIGALTDPYVEVLNDILEEQVHTRTSALKTPKGAKKPETSSREAVTRIGRMPEPDTQEENFTTPPGRASYSEAAATTKIGIDGKEKEGGAEEVREGGTDIEQVLPRAQRKPKPRQQKRKKTSQYTGVTRDEIELERTIDIIINIITDLFTGAKITAAEAQEAAQTFKENVSGVSESVKAQAQQTTADLRSRAGDASRRAQEQVLETVDKGTQQAKQYTRKAVDTAKDVVSQGLQAVESELHHLREGIQEGREGDSKTKQARFEEVPDEVQQSGHKVYDSARKFAEHTVEKTRETLGEGLHGIEKRVESVERGIEVGKKGIEKTRKTDVEQELRESGKKAQEKTEEVVEEAKKRTRMPTPEKRGEWRAQTPEKRDSGHGQRKGTSGGRG